MSTLNLGTKLLNFHNLFLHCRGRGHFFQLETDIVKGLGTFSSSMEVGKAKSKPETETLNQKFNVLIT